MITEKWREELIKWLLKFKKWKDVIGMIKIIANIDNSFCCEENFSILNFNDFNSDKQKLLTKRVTKGKRDEREKYLSLILLTLK